jgi:ATP-binding cassette subfamily G (WHITE) protein 2 (SNQ2)
MIHSSTRGLDASTALEYTLPPPLTDFILILSSFRFGRALRIATDMDRMTTIVSIYQAGETLYQLFDKVCVIYEGKMAYFGPADQARQYFINMGYEPANRQTTPDFLVAVSSSDLNTKRFFDAYTSGPCRPLTPMAVSLVKGSLISLGLRQNSQTISSSRPSRI